MGMTVKAHYLLTLCALVFLGMIISNSKVGSPQKLESEYRINTNNEVQYKFN